MTFPDRPPGITFRVIYGRSHVNVSTSGNSPLALPSFLYLIPKSFFTDNFSGLHKKALEDYRQIPDRFIYSLNSILKQCSVCVGVSPPAFLFKLRSSMTSMDLYVSIDRALLSRCLLNLYRNCFLRCYTRSVANRSESQRLRMTFPDRPPGITFRVIYGRSHMNVSTFGNSPLALQTFCI
jgi:hypothetical protein